MRSFFSRWFIAPAMAALFALAAPLQAQTPPRIAWIWPGTPEGTATVRAAFLDGMRENGYVEGKGYLLEERYAEGKYERFPGFVDEVLSLDPAIIMVNVNPAIRAAQKATKTVPIVFVYTHDPVGSGLVQSLSRPGGNTTGLANQFEDVIGKYLELLHELLPRATRLAVLVNPLGPSSPQFFARVSSMAAAMGIEAQRFDASRIEEIDPAIEAIVRHKPDALLIIPDAVFYDQRARIATLATARKLPAIAPQSEYAGAGCLVAYGTNRREVFRRSAIYVKRILDGAKPGEIPVEQPTRFELVVNLSTAKALGITIPQSVLLRADGVIQ
jgi:putative ABC transport system substrate-binding protein